MINHPAKDELPNVVVCPYDMPTIGPEEDLSQLLRSKYYKEPMLSKIFDPLGKIKMHTYLLVAACDIDPGQEIFVNYRYNPNLSAKLIPDWYHPIDVDENERRWNRGQ
jgi:hypothetical protein